MNAAGDPICQEAVVRIVVRVRDGFSSFTVALPRVVLPREGEARPERALRFVLELPPRHVRAARSGR